MDFNIDYLKDIIPKRINDFIVKTDFTVNLQQEHLYDDLNRPLFDPLNQYIEVRCDLACVHDKYKKQTFVYKHGFSETDIYLLSTATGDYLEYLRDCILREVKDFVLHLIEWVNNI